MYQGSSHHHGCGHLLQEVAEEGGCQHTVDHQHVGHANHEADLWVGSSEWGTEGLPRQVSSLTMDSPVVP